MRGNRRQGHDRRVGSGSIPACAGEPPGSTAAGRRPRVYPRVCGGTTEGIDVDQRHTGLSPRVRGNRIDDGVIVPSEGSIPACAGEPRSSSRASGWSRVYPRVCGGTGFLMVATILNSGLSPRVRGNHRTITGRGGLGRSIPACAGEPATRANRAAPQSVYPRVCGGTPRSIRSANPETGLSPRVRGNLVVPSPIGARKGSIPACAGEPGKREESNDRPGVYPRVCGGTAADASNSRTYNGLSPRVRGNLNVVERANQVDGSIPACAGEPPLRSGAT